jgi:uncharacterized iron-regulated membrane protein
MVDVVGSSKLPEVKARPAQKAQRFWWQVHHWVGLKLSLLMGFILLTGTLATLSNEIDWLINPAQRVAPASVTHHDWVRMADGAQSRLRPGERILSLDAPVDPWFAASAIIETGEDSAPRFVYLHPSTGEVTGEGSWITVQRVLRNTHRHLMLPTKIGVPIVSALSLLLFISLVTAFVVYKKWWLGFFKPIRFRDARTAWGDMHRLAGLWGIWFVALMAVTGLWYLVESIGGAAPDLPKSRAPAVTVAQGEWDDALARSLATVRTAYPELRIGRIVFPTETQGVFQFQGQDKAILVRDRANAVWTQAIDGRHLRTTRAEELNVHQRISEMADPLHFGTFGGLATKVIWFAFGAVLTALCVSGAAIYSSRIIKATPKLKVRQSQLYLLWHGMGPWRWLSVVALLTVAVIMPVFFLRGGE